MKGITLFTIPRAFAGHTGMIQRNALRSWQELNVEVILCGNEQGVKEAATEFGYKHIPDIKCNSYGTPLLNDVLEKVDNIASNDVLGFFSTDLILIDDLPSLVSRVKQRDFLIVGRRYDIYIDYPLLLESSWQENIRAYAFNTGRLSDLSAIDYIIYPIGFFKGMPPYAVGKSRQDNWFILYAKKHNVPVIDVTDALTIIHQDHRGPCDIYRRDVDQPINTWDGPEYDINKKLYGYTTPCYTLLDANWKMTQATLTRTLHIEAMKHDLLRAMHKH